MELQKKEQQDGFPMSNYQTLCQNSEREKFRLLDEDHAASFLAV